MEAPSRTGCSLTKKGPADPRDDASFKQHIVDYVAQLAADHDTVGTERQFQTTSGRTVSVSGSAYGWKIDQDGEVAQLTPGDPVRSSDDQRAGLFHESQFLWCE